LPRHAHFGGLPACVAASRSGALQLSLCAHQPMRQSSLAVGDRTQLLRVLCTQLCFARSGASGVLAHARHIVVQQLQLF
jgi:hypothetical protein